MSQKPGVVVAPDHPAPPQAAQDGHDDQSMPTPTSTAPEVPPPASATPPQEAPYVPPAASAPPPQAEPHVPPSESAAPPKAVAGLSRAEPPPPPPKVVEPRRPLQGQPVQSTSANAQRVPISEPVKEYLVAVKTYEQQVGPNIVRGKMFVESLPTTPRAMLAEQRFSPMPGTEYGQDMDIGPGKDYMYAPMSSDQGLPMGGEAPPYVQRSREDFHNLALGHDIDIDLAKMAEMGPAMRRILDMGSRIDQILDVANMPHVGRGRSGCAQPSGPVMAESYGRPPPTGYVAPMGRCSAEACPRDPRLYGAQKPRMGGRPSYEGSNYARRPCSRETTAYVGENRRTRRSMSRASELLDRIRQDIDEHRAENMPEKIRAVLASTDDGEPDVRVRHKRHSMPHGSRPPSRNVQTTSYDDDYCFVRREYSRPLQQRSQRVKNSSSSSSSSSSLSSVDRPRRGSSKRSKQYRTRKFEGHELLTTLGPILLIVGAIMMILLIMMTGSRR